MILTLHLLRIAATAPSLESCLEREFAAVLALLRGHDFYEGVRAAVIEKDRTPRWSPATLDAVEAATVTDLPMPAEGLFPKHGAAGKGAP